MIRTKIPPRQTRPSEDDKRDFFLGMRSGMGCEDGIEGLADINHLLLIDGLFAPCVTYYQCLCGHECHPQDADVGWISLIPDDEDYINLHGIGILGWIERHRVGGVSGMCDTCIDKTTRMEKMVALGG